MDQDSLNLHIGSLVSSIGGRDDLLPSNIEGVSAYEVDNYISQGSFSPEDEKEIRDNAYLASRRVKDIMGYGRFSPILDDGSADPAFVESYTPAPIASEGESEEVYAKKFDLWKSEQTKKLDELYPYSKDDNEQFVKSAGNGAYAESLYNIQQPWFITQMGNKAVEGAAGFVVGVVDAEAAEEFTAKNFASDPKLDDPTKNDGVDWFKSMALNVSSGIGQAVPQAAVATAGFVAGGPTGAYLASSAVNARHAYEAAYNEEFAKSGNKESADAAGWSQLPSSQLESLADVAALGMAPAAKASLKASFSAAKTVAEKAAIIKAAMPTSAGAVAKGFASEFVVGSLATDAASAYGKYLATGNTEYLDELKPEKMFTSALIEGMVGGFMGGGSHIANRTGDVDSKIEEALRPDTEEENKIRRAAIRDNLIKGDYEAAVKTAQTPGAVFDIVQQARAATQQSASTSPGQQGSATPTTTQTAGQPSSGQAPANPLAPLQKGRTTIYRNNAASGDAVSIAPAEQDEITHRSKTNRLSAEYKSLYLDDPNSTFDGFAVNREMESNPKDSASDLPTVEIKDEAQKNRDLNGAVERSKEKGFVTVKTLEGNEVSTDKDQTSFIDDNGNDIEYDAHVFISDNSPKGKDDREHSDTHRAFQQFVKVAARMGGNVALAVSKFGSLGRFSYTDSSNTYTQGSKVYKLRHKPQKTGDMIFKISRKKDTNGKWVATTKYVGRVGSFVDNKPGAATSAPAATSATTAQATPVTTPVTTEPPATTATQASTAQQPSSSTKTEDDVQETIAATEAQPVPESFEEEAATEEVKDDVESLAEELSIADEIAPPPSSIQEGATKEEVSKVLEARGVDVQTIDADTIDIVATADAEKFSKLNPDVKDAVYDMLTPEDAAEPVFRNKMLEDAGVAADEVATKPAAKLTPSQIKEEIEKLKDDKSARHKLLIEQYSLLETERVRSRFFESLILPEFSNKIDALTKDIDINNRDVFKNYAVQAVFDSIASYDSSRATSFDTHVGNNIKYAISKAKIDESKLSKIDIENLSKINKAKRAIFEENPESTEEPSVDELSERTGLTVKVINNLLSAREASATDSIDVNPSVTNAAKKEDRSEDADQKDFVSKLTEELKEKDPYLHKVLTGEMTVKEASEASGKSESAVRKRRARFLDGARKLYERSQERYSTSNLRYSYIGELRSNISNTLRTDLSAAKALHKHLAASRGHDSDRFSNTQDKDIIRKATGWFLAEDGKWRYEISDADSSVDSDTLKRAGNDLLQNPEKDYYIPIDVAFEHKALFQIYPKLKDDVLVVYKMGKFGTADVVRTKDVDESGERRDTYTITIYLSPDAIAKHDQKSTLVNIAQSMLHELTHVIQYEEGFSLGSNPESVELRRVEDERAAKENRTPDYFQAYMDVYGEKEARDVERRLILDMLARQNLAPFSSDKNTIFVEESRVVSAVASERRHPKAMPHTEVEAYIQSKYPDARIVVVDDPSMVTNAGRLASGKYDPKNNIVVINSAGVSSTNDIDSVIDEELFHAGYDEVVNLIKPLASKLTEADMAKSREKYSEQGEDVVLEEALFAKYREMMKSSREASMLRKAYNAIKAFFKRMLGINDIESLVKRAMRIGYNKLSNQRAIDVANAVYAISAAEGISIKNTNASTSISELVSSLGYSSEDTGHSITVKDQNGKKVVSIKRTAPKDNLVEVDAKTKEGYMLAANWAANNGKKISTTPNESNISWVVDAMMAYGDVLSLLPSQLTRNAYFIDGKYSNNLGQAAILESDIAHESNPSLFEVDYNIKTGNFSVNGVPVKNSYFDNIGGASSQRAVITRKILQGNRHLGDIPGNVLFSTSKKSTEQKIDEEYFDAIANNDIKKAENILLKVAEMRGYDSSLLLYSGLSGDVKEIDAGSRHPTKKFERGPKGLWSTVNKNYASGYSEDGVYVRLFYKKLSNKNTLNPDVDIVNLDDGTSFHRSENNPTLSFSEFDKIVKNFGRYPKSWEYDDGKANYGRTDGLEVVSDELTNLIYNNFRRAGRNPKLLDILAYGDYDKDGGSLLDNSNERLKITEVFKSHGFDFYIQSDFNNLGGFVSLKGGSDVKSASIITKDDNGKIIPPSKRFDQANSDIRYSTSNLSNDTGPKADVSVLQSIKDKIKELKGRVIEPELSQEEQMAFKQIMSIKWDFLPEKYVEGRGFQAFLSIIEDFVETRSESGVYPDHRLVTEDVYKAMNDLQLLADANEKQQILNENPDVFDNVDPGQMTLQQVKDHLKNQLAAAGLIEKALSPKKKQELKEKRDSVKAKTRERLSLEESVQSLVGQFKDAFNKIANGEKSGTGLDNIIKDDYVSGISDHIQDAPEAIIKAANKLRQDFNQKAKLHAASVIHYVINQVDTSTMGPVELRMFYYNLQSMLADGDRMFDYSGLIPADVAEILTKTHEFRNPDLDTLPGTSIPIKSISDIENHVSSIYLLLDKMGVTQESKNALQNIVANFATQIEVAQRYETEVLIPLEHHFEKRANKLGADVHNTYKLEDSGIFATLRQPIGNESMYDAIMAASDQLRRSIDNRKKHSERKLRESALREEATLNALMEGIEQNPTNAEDILEANAKRVIGEGYVQYVKDIASFFSWTQPMAEFTTKFVLGRTYQPIRNYIPFTQHRVNNSDGIKAKDTQTNSVTLQGNSDDEIKEFGISLSEITLDGTANEGMSSTYERKRKIGNDYALILNVKHSFQTRGRLNILDYVTATDRRGMSATLNSEALNKFLGDETQGLQTQRRAHLKKTITQLWKQAVLSNRYVTSGEVAINAAVGSYNAYLLSGAHQFPAQLASAYASYTMSNMFSPKKLLALKQAGVFYARYISGNLTERERDFVEDITYAIKARSADVVTDKNSNLRMSGRGVLERVIGSNYSSKVKEAHEKIIRASAIAFKASDALSGKPIMLAEYLSNESARIGHDVSFEQLANMQKNPASYQRALNQTERHLAPGNKARRSEFTSGINKYANLSKLVGFRFVSHMLNMATHSSAAMRDFVDAPMSEKPQHAAYVMATVSQAFVFAATRSYMQLAIGGLILSCLNGGLDDEEEQKAAIEDLLKEREDGRKSSKEKEIIDARINAIKGFAEMTQKVAAKGDFGVVALRSLSDSLSQMHVFGTIADQANGTSIVGHAIFDKSERASFNANKLSEISRLQEELKSSRLLPSERVEKLTEIKYLESQQSIDTWFTLPGRGLGLKGPLFDVAEQWGSSAMSILDGEASGADIASTLSLFGIGQSDVTRFLKDKEKIAKIQKELDKRILEIEKKYEKK